MRIPNTQSNEEANSLLRSLSSDDEDPTSVNQIPRPVIPLPERRQSSLSIPLADGLPRKPRTPNRVRFEVAEQSLSDDLSHRRITEPEEEDYFSNDALTGEGGNASQRAPLLTGIEAPSVTVANTSFDINAEDLLENSRPKSGMKSAFMNMANSIM
ncbi:MAG: hypothetical protein Q9166_003542 [cf. Caloplaca sp. 2 TL-2023]